MHFVLDITVKLIGIAVGFESLLFISQNNISCVYELPRDF